jgi:hypothetical protein
MRVVNNEYFHFYPGGRFSSSRSGQAASCGSFEKSLLHAESGKLFRPVWGGRFSCKQCVLFSCVHRNTSLLAHIGQVQAACVEDAVVSMHSIPLVKQKAPLPCLCPCFSHDLFASVVTFLSDGSRRCISRREAYTFQSNGKSRGSRGNFWRGDTLPQIMGYTYCSDLLQKNHGMGKELPSFPCFLLLRRFRYRTQPRMRCVCSYRFFLDRSIEQRKLGQYQVCLNCKGRQSLTGRVSDQTQLSAVPVG